jgi:SAM-dependent methyltransferase
MSKNIQFWNQKHEDSDNWWLSDTSLKEVLTYHHLAENDFRDRTVLEIGIGTGRMSREIKNLGCILYCCDISDKALDRVKDIADQTFLTEDIKDVPPVDIAICHLVFQHCDNNEIFRILNDVNLTAQGTLSFEFPSYGLYQQDEAFRKLVEDGSHFFRDVLTMQRIVAASNKEVTSVFTLKWRDDHDLTSNFFKVKGKQ